MAFFNSRGEEVDEAPGPRGDRMAQLGILTRAQKKKPVMNPMDQSGASQMLAEKAQERKAQILSNQGNTIAERDPMKGSLQQKSPMKRIR